MPDNDQIVLDTLLQQTRLEVAPDMPSDEYFEIFVSEQVLKDYDLSFDEIQSGIVDGGGDGGMDAIFVFANGDLVHEDTDLSQIKKHATLELVIIQATTSNGFSETRLHTLTASTVDLLDLSKDPDAFAALYNDSVRKTICLFREKHASLIPRFPTVHLRYVLAARASAVHPNVKTRAERLKEAVHGLFSNAQCDVEFLGNTALLQLARRRIQTSYKLPLIESFGTAAQVGFVCLVRLTDYFKFISSESGSLQRHLFEANVRDYQGSTEVNQQIKMTLADGADEDFWWLNNGVSIIASKADLTSKTLTIQDPQVVNGLQTSTEIHNHFAGGGKKDDPRMLLVRVIVPVDQASRDKIIKATNSQTKIPSASLRATDKIHRDIEEYLKPRGLYYDRRKNFYRNQGFAVEKIVGIAYLAQAVMAIALHRPDNARSRPSSLLNRDDDYRQVFDPEQPIALYLVCAQLMKRVEANLRAAGLPVPVRGNIRFHVAMATAWLATGQAEPSPDTISKISVSDIPEDVLAHATALVADEFASQGNSDAVAKAAEFLAKLSARIASTLAQRSLPFLSLGSRPPGAGILSG